MREKQVDRVAYRSDHYLHPDRWASYYFQIKELLDLKPKSVLEIGVGDKVFGSYLKNNTDIYYKTLDIAADLEPDFLGSVDHIPLTDFSYEVVCAFEVLEHLPFSQFTVCLEELKRVSQKYVLLSLPHFGPAVKFKIKIPLLSEKSFSFKLPFPRKHEFNGQHYWEIGTRGCSRKTVRNHIAVHFRIIKEFVPFDNQYHRFYVLEKNV